MSGFIDEFLIVNTQINAFPNITRTFFVDQNALFCGISVQARPSLFVTFNIKNCWAKLCQVIKRWRNLFMWFYTMTGSMYTNTGSMHTPVEHMHTSDEHVHTSSSACVHLKTLVAFTPSFAHCQSFLES